MGSFRGFTLIYIVLKDSRKAESHFKSLLQPENASHTPNGCGRLDMGLGGGCLYQPCHVFNPDKWIRPDYYIHGCLPGVADDEV